MLAAKISTCLCRLLTANEAQKHPVRSVGNWVENTFVILAQFLLQLKKKDLL